MILLTSRNFYLHVKENSRELRTFPDTSMTMPFLISRCKVILLENSYDQINILFTTTC